MSCDVKGYLKNIQNLVLDENPVTKDIAKQVFGNIKRNGSANTVAVVEDHLLNEMGNGKAFNRIYNKPTGRQGFNGIVKSVKLNEDGTARLSVVDKDNPKTAYTYDNVNMQTGRNTDGQRVQVAVGLSDKLFTPTSTNVSNFIGGASVIANKYVSHMLVGTVEKSGGVLAPIVKKWHTQAKRKSGIYKDTTNLIATGFGNPELLAKIKAHLFLSGDISRQTIADATTISAESARLSFEILDTNMPKLEKDIAKSIRDVKTREKLDTIFGTSGYGSMYEIPGLMEAIYEGRPMKDLMAIVGGSKGDIAIAREIRDYQVHRKVNATHQQNSNGNKKVAALTALLALSEKAEDGKTGYDTLLWLKNKHGKLFVDLDKLAASVYTLNEVVNNSKQGTSFGNGPGVVYKGYDGHGTMDVFDTTLEFKMISEKEYESGKYLTEGTPWKIMRKPGPMSAGVLYRKSTSSTMEGLGVNLNRVQNGISVPTDKIPKDRSGNVDQAWVLANNIVIDVDSGYPRYRMILDAKEYDTVGGKKDISQRLYRTFVHNKQLIETETVRNLIRDKMTLSGQDGMLDRLNSTIRRNGKVKDEEKREVLPFLKTDIPWSTIEKDYPEVAKRYKRVENISNYGNFDQDIQYVRKDLADMLVGHGQKLLISDEYPSAQKWEKAYKEIIQLMKLKMVVANPAKLGVDFLSNMGILMTTDVSALDSVKYSREALNYSTEMSALEASLVQAKLEVALNESTVAKNRVASINKRIEEHPYYDAVRFGFIQSMGTSMMIKEFDTISGLQHTIDELVTNITTDDKGKKNEIHKGIKWWMDAGFGANDILDAVSGISKIKGTAFADELIEISGRLKDKKQTEDTVRYVSEFIAAPSSEAVRQGSRAMQMGDVMARWAMYVHGVKTDLDKKGLKYNDGSTGDFLKSLDRLVSAGSITAEELENVKKTSSLVALDTFVDYRLNMPKEVKVLSDYGVLMFPAFWMRTQRVIYNLAKYHPLNAGLGFVAVDLLGIGGASILDANVLSKVDSGTLLHAGQFANVFDPGTYVLGL